MMNIFNNNQNYTLSQQTGTLSVLGNYNTLRIARSQMTITVNGNHNTFIIHNSAATFTINGNLNVIRAGNSTLTYGFNGNQNQVMVDPNTTHNLQYCNGIGNQFPNAVQNRGNRGYRSQQPQQNNNANRNNRRMPQQSNNFQFAYQQQEPANFRPRNFNNYYPSQNNGFNPFSMGFGSFGGGNFMQGFAQSMNNIFSSPMARNSRHYQFNNQPFGFNFQMYEPEQEEVVQIIQVEGQEERGLNTEELGILPRTKHEGKDGKCTICLCEITRGDQQTFLMCFHPFHTECIGDWLKKSGKCPICQFNVKRHLRGEE